MLLIAVAAWLALREVEQRRWNGYIRSLESQPGIVVTNEGRAGDRFHVRGLRDPLAADPDALLAASGFSREGVITKWEAYESLQPRFKDERRYAQLKDSLERKYFRFRLGSAEIPPELDAQIAEIVADVRALEENATRTGRNVRIEIRGDTDPLGPEQLNLTLAQDRAKAVAEGLVVNGIDSSRLVLRGRGEGRLPCAGASERERASCRSVSLRVLEGGSTP